MKELGQLLKKTRTEKNLSLEDISSQTKIQLSILKRIEDGNTKDLPHTAHLRGFIRQYAKLLDLDVDEVMKLFTLGDPPPSPAALKITENASSANESKTNVLWFRASSKLITFAGIVIAVILLIAIYSLSMKINSYNQEAATVGEISEPSDIDMQTTLTLPSTEDNNEETDTKATHADPKMISIEAFDEVMVNAIWSTGKKEKIVLKTNRKHTFYYSDKIKLEISDAGVVNVITSKENLGIPGELGQSIELDFD